MFRFQLTIKEFLGQEAEKFVLESKGRNKVSKKCYTFPTCDKFTASQAFGKAGFRTSADKTTYSKPSETGWGTDEKAIISILGRRNAIQRKLIRKAYEDMYQEDLVKRLESELSGDFEKAVYRWTLDPEDRDALLLNVAIKQLPIPDYRVIVEISCIPSHEELLAIKHAYQIRYKHSVEEDLAQHTTGDIRQHVTCSPHRILLFPNAKLLFITIQYGIMLSGDTLNTASGRLVSVYSTMARRLMRG
ncbi:Annexin D8 [Abeliophyllum distichum]|uniref:Annexin D8 n=1 Tax=Abeliophyllum distichum TaxID=126358 RepID=A0ABD1NWQ6_9LAMI